MADDRSPRLEKLSSMYLHRCEVVIAKAIRQKFVKVRSLRATNEVTGAWWLAHVMPLVKAHDL